MKIQGPVKFKAIYQDATKASFRKFGFINAKLCSEWKTIIGKNLAEICLLDQITFEYEKSSGGTLHLILTNPAYMLEIQALKNTIIERIATYFGYRAVSKITIKIRLDAVKSDINLHPKPTSANHLSKLPAIINMIKDDNLKNVLSSLYQNLRK